ncbi:MAG: nicotinate-nucleotide--dimethylbenzimidazole phosphoribosyltransferase [Bacteroidaceae bacterium]|nr:nicotinate-nucleotide--dimethylbenzimidazole phosphoribosyltransferase [Bacteroidaceae bacterium]
MIEPTDKSFVASIQQKIDNLNKPKGSLGRLESLALQICLVQKTLNPQLKNPCHILFGADHGIEREGVSVSPREVTWQQMINFGRGGGGVNMFCRQHGFKLRLVDMGVDHDFNTEESSCIIDRKIAYGTRNFLFEPAMTEQEFEKAMRAGAEMVDECKLEESNVVCFGEMGIANTSPSSVWMHLLTGLPLHECVGAGAGLCSEGQRHKLDVITRSVEHFLSSAQFGRNAEMAFDREEIIYIIRYFGGFEMVAAIGGMIRAAEQGMLILVDGFIMTACMLAASRLEPSIIDYAIFGHCGDESGHRAMLNAIGAQPLLSLGLRLGEGTGAICAYPIVQSAVAMMNEMDNFEHAKITKYF